VIKDEDDQLVCDAMEVIVAFFQFCWGHVVIRRDDYEHAGQGQDVSLPEPESYGKKQR
jgi:hypothetical protein